MEIVHAPKNQNFGRGRRTRETRLLTPRSALGSRRGKRWGRDDGDGVDLQGQTNALKIEVGDNRPVVASPKLALHSDTARPAGNP